MKKFSILVTLLLIVGMLTVSAFAAQTATVTVSTSSTTVHNGDTFTVTVDVSSVENCIAGGFMFNYNTDVFEYVSGSALVEGFTAAGVSTTNGNLAGYFMGNTANIQGSVFQITLKVKDNAALGNYTISGAANLVSKVAGVEEAVSCTVTAATVTVACNHADANNDGLCDVCETTLVLTDANLNFYSSKGDLMLGDEIKGSFVMNAKGRTYDDYYVEFKMGEAITNVPVSMTSGNYRYFFYTVFAFRMTETVEVTLYGVKDGEVYRGQSVTWTVRDSIVAKLDSWIGAYETDAKKAAACDLLANMLHYGTEAQKELNKENTNYPTDNLDSKYIALIKTTTPAMGTKPADDESGKQATVYRMGMMLQEKIKLYAQFKVSNASATQNSDYSAVIELIHKDGTTSKYEFAADELTISGTKTKYVTVQFDKVNCQEMRCTMNFALYLNGEQISATIIRSADMLANDLLNTYPTLIPAIMNYSDCAERYFGM